MIQKAIDELAKEKGIDEEWVLFTYKNKEIEIISHNNDRQKAIDEALLKYKSNDLVIAYITNRDDEPIEHIISG